MIADPDHQSRIPDQVAVGSQPALPRLAGGYIQKQRSPFRELLQKIPPRLRANAWAFWDLALMRCNWEDEAGGLRRGQFYFGRQEMAEELGLTPQKFRTVLKRFCDLGELTIQANNHGSRGTVDQFNIYVEPHGGSGIGNGSKLTRQQPADNQQLTTLKNLRAEELERREYSPEARRASGPGNADAFPAAHTEIRERPALSENLVAALEALGYGFRREGYRSACYEFITSEDRGESAVWFALNKVWERYDNDTIRTSPEVLLLSIFRNGLMPDEQYRLAQGEER
ncbi:MAG: hypothetical protein EXS58_08830 [Candidatus Latescibacteria bacterium]|nr:hypothetical protein [Candidatus Latescibacterota bacterium]